MAFPEFFDSVPRISLRDPLAGFLGAAEDGVIEYTYADVVKLAGHSCPTVASAYLMTRAALRALYPDSLPERGGIRLELREQREEGRAGVIANVASFLTGATYDNGFKGIAGRFDRRGLLFFGVEFPGQIRYTRLDTGNAVTASARLDRIPVDPRTALLLPRCLAETATPDEAALFQSLWQGRVRKLVIEHADDREVILIQRAQDAQAPSDAVALAPMA